MHTEWMELIILNGVELDGGGGKSPIMAQET